jgi:uncharacterized protein
MVKDIFFIPHKNNFIIYVPLKGILLYGNLALAQTFKTSLSNHDHLPAEMTSLLQNDLSAENQQRFCLPNQESNLYKPKSVTFLLTDSCTLRCKYCYANGGSTNATLEWQIFESVSSEIAENIVSAGQNQFSVSFHGGDIGSCWNLFVDAVEHLKLLSARNKLELNISAGINGVLNHRQREFFVNNIRHATVSFDGTPEIQNSLRPFPNGSGSFSAVNETLKYFDMHAFNYSLRGTVSASSVHQMEQSLHFIASSYMVKTIMFEPLFPIGRAVENSEKPPTGVEFVENFRKAGVVAEKNERRLIYSGARLNLLTCNFCMASIESCVITPSGMISSCYEVMHDSDPFADFFLYGTFNKKKNRLIIDPQKREKLTGMTVAKMEKCQNCFCKYHCAGDCPLKSLIWEQDKNYNEPDRCYINRELTKDQLIKALGLS